MWLGGLGLPGPAGPWANGANLISYLIPCHRVLRSSGVVGDYRWGHTRKQAILAWVNPPTLAGMGIDWRSAPRPPTLGRLSTVPPKVGAKGAVQNIRQSAHFTRPREWGRMDGTCHEVGNGVEGVGTLNARSYFCHDANPKSPIENQKSWNPSAPPA